MHRTKIYEEYLLGCRFCPMCKPASDTLNSTFIESLSTRARAMIIWRVLNGERNYTPKEAELLYRTNLDGVSEAFCVDHYPVSDYLLAAREDIVASGPVPAPVEAILEREYKVEIEPKGETVLFAEGMELDFNRAWAKAVGLGKKIDAGVIAGYTGYLPYVLGCRNKAVAEAKAFTEALVSAEVKTVVAPGPESYYTFTKLYQELGVEFPVQVVSLIQSLFNGSGASGVAGRKVFFHDTRASYNLRESDPDEMVIQPDFFGPEELLGSGEVYELPRLILQKGGADLVFSVWSRGLANAMGNDEGLSLTYPKLAKTVTKRRLQHIADLGAELVVTDSLATVIYLDSLEGVLPEGLTYKYLGDLK